MAVGDVLMLEVSMTPFQSPTEAMEPRCVYWKGRTAARPCCTTLCGASLLRAAKAASANTSLFSFIVFAR